MSGMRDTGAAPPDYRRDRHHLQGERFLRERQPQNRLRWWFFVFTKFQQREVLRGREDRDRFRWRYERILRRCLRILVGLAEDRLSIL